MAQSIKSKFNNLLERSKNAVDTNYFKLMVKGNTGIYYAHPAYGHADYNKHRVCDITPYTLRLMKQFNANFK